MTTDTGRQPRVLSLAAAALLAIAAATVAPRSASASLGACRSDPTAVLSNGAVIDLSATIGTSISNVSSVVYRAHLPRGVYALLTVNTDSLIGPKERFMYDSDNAAGRYDVYTTVQVVSGKASVSAWTVVISLISIGSPIVPGTSGSPIHTSVSSLLG